MIQGDDIRAKAARYKAALEKIVSMPCVPIDVYEQAADALCWARKIRVPSALPPAEDAAWTEREAKLATIEARVETLRTGLDQRDWKSIAEGLLLAIETKEELTSVRRRFGLDEKGDVEPSESNPPQPAPLAKDEAASLHSGTDCPLGCAPGDHGVGYRKHCPKARLDADGTASDYDRARALAEQWADVFGADVPERINLTRRVAALLGDVRRETIQACAAWLDAQLKANSALMGFVDGADMVAAMTKKDGEP